MAWTEIAAIVSGGVSLIVLLVGTLARETTTELRRRLERAESIIDSQRVLNGELQQKLARVEVRSDGTIEALREIRESMVPRSEWEARHKQTDDMLRQILASLAERPGSSPGPKR